MSKRDERTSPPSAPAAASASASPSGQQPADATSAEGRSVDVKTLAQQFRKMKLLADLALDKLQQLAQAAEPLSLRRRQVLYLPGDPGESVYVVLSGRLKISKVTRDGKELTLAYRGPGELLGEACLPGGAVRTEMVETTEASEVAVFPRQAFARVVQSSGSLGYALMLDMIERRRELEDKVEQLLFKDVSAKLAELLLQLESEFGVSSSTGRGTLVGLKITHQEMANLIGATRETVSLTLSQFRRKGYIETDGRKVIIADREGLRALA